VGAGADGPLALDGVQASIIYAQTSGPTETDEFAGGALTIAVVTGHPAALEEAWTGPEFLRSKTERGQMARYMRDPSPLQPTRNEIAPGENERLTRAAKERVFARVAQLRACLGWSQRPLESCRDP
jgi:hypothetical protein